MKIAIINTQMPHGMADARESLDAALALSGFTENLSVFFLDDGVYQLVENQQPQSILQRHIQPTFKLFDLYDIETVYVCEQSCLLRGIDPKRLCIPVQLLQPQQLSEKLHQQQQIIRF
ncbi:MULTISPECIES: sulfurtransferase complex subunit TusC [unclassified Motilimonas]|uniref:sulfurtransferase complex subunit TusC n=1 Tax=Motilimonas TaxID=1914248 RepID=UPI001E2E68B4|nr:MULTISPECIES: sulfurtransferase complex subunit TusC [unclassified Motilimonas]MCE0556502.1 sulfurtransferase complex subunit TusC [Motilimonas sp. E26]MDO6527985.1 sulfurtransferase complex subunit TusC [Motilimonas sp. 1_MG-2023]